MSSDEAGFIDVETLIMDGCRAGVAGERVLNNTNGEPGEALVAEQRWLMRYVARRLSADLRAAVGPEDVVQETFVAALRHDRGLPPAGDGALRRWLASLANNRLCDLARRRRRMKRAGAAGECQSDGDEATTEARRAPDDRLHADEERAILAAAIGDLREEYREAIRLRYLCGLDVSEVAARLGRSPGAAAMLCHRALKRLRRAWASRPGM